METSEGRCSALREEFRLVKFGLHHYDPSLFVRLQCFEPKFYIIWTSFWTVFYVAMLSLDVFYNYEYGTENFIYLTNWSYLLQSAHAFLNFSVTIYVHLRRKDIQDGKVSGTTWYLKSLWVIFNVNNAVSILVTILYHAQLDAVFTHASINKHLLNTMYTLLTVFFTASPVQILHVYQPVVFGLVYAVFSIIYHVTGNPPIYSILDWSDIGNTALLSCLAMFVALPVTHIAVFAIHTLRKFIFYNCACFENLIKNEELKREITTGDVESQDASKTQHPSNQIAPILEKY